MTMNMNSLSFPHKNKIPLHKNRTSCSYNLRRNCNQQLHTGNLEVENVKFDLRDINHSRAFSNILPEQAPLYCKGILSVEYIQQ